MVALVTKEYNTNTDSKGIQFMLYTCNHGSWGWIPSAIMCREWLILVRDKNFPPTLIQLNQMTKVTEENWQFVMELQITSVKKFFSLYDNLRDNKKHVPLMLEPAFVKPVNSVNDFSWVDACFLIQTRHMCMELVIWFQKSMGYVGVPYLDCWVFCQVCWPTKASSKCQKSHTTTNYLTMHAFFVLCGSNRF